jgi:hypothetical protein
LSASSTKFALVIIASALSTTAYAASHKVLRVTDSVPKFDMARECRAEGGSAATIDSCAVDEAAARDHLQPIWHQSSATERASCLGETDMDDTPSYVELEICLKMDRDVKKLPK